MDSQQTTTSTYERYRGSPPQRYEQYFVPTIGIASARPLLDIADLRAGERVLDVGCGTGVATRLAAEAVGTDGKVVGTDVNPGMLEVARTTVPAGASVEWHRAGAEDLPLPDASFDAVLCSLALMFFTDKVQGLREMRRVLAPGGRAVVSTPGPMPPLFQVFDEVLAEHVGPEASMFVNAVFSLHDPDEVLALLETAGFEGTDVQHRTTPTRTPPTADFFWQYVAATPLSALAAQLDDEGRAAVEHDVVERCRPFADGDGLVLRPGLLVFSANRDAG